MDEDTEFVQLLMCTAAWLLLKRRKKRRIRKWRVRPSVQVVPSRVPVVKLSPAAVRRERPEYRDLLTEMMLQDENTFFEYTRMDAQTFESLLNIMGPHLQKNSRRTPIPPRIRLAMTLRYLATGESMKSIAGAYKFGNATVCIIVNDTCHRLWTVLAPQFVNLPASHEEWLQIADKFEEKWNLPHCVGAVDCRHVSIRTQKSVPLFCSRKLGTGVVLLATCDSDHCFTYLDIEAYNEHSGGGGIMKTSDFGKLLDTGTLALPAQRSLPGETDQPVPYYFVGDETFPLKQNLMRPYAGRDMSDVKKIFNYRLSRAQRCMENVFGVLVARWHVYLNTINAHPLTVRKIIRATVCLHNFLKKRGSQLYCPSSGFLDEESVFGDIVPGQWRAEVSLHCCALQRIGRLGSNSSKRSSMLVRDTLAAYLVSEVGSIESQWHQVEREQQE